AQDSFIFLPSGDVFRATARYGFTRQYHEFIESNPPKMDRGSLVGRAAIERHVVHVSDVLTDPNYARFDAQRIGGYRAALAVPLLREGSVVGVIFLSRTKPQPFTDKQIELVKTFADQAVIAIENVRLFEAEQQRTRELSESLEQQTATSEVLQIISNTPGALEPVFEAMLDKAVRICDAKFGNIYRWDGELLHLLAAHNTPPALAEARQQSAIRPTSEKVGVRRMVETKTAAHVVDLAADESYVGAPAAVDAVELGSVRTFLSVPMVKENELIGSFSLYRQEVRPFTDKQIALVTSFANQ